MASIRSTTKAMALVANFTIASTHSTMYYLSVQGHDVERELVDVCFPKWSAVLALLGAVEERQRDGVEMTLKISCVEVFGERVIDLMH